MKVRCERDETEFVAKIELYPGRMKYIQCPTCGRRYFFYEETGKWTADRDLTILP